VHHNDFDVLANGEVVGRIFKVNAAPVGMPWLWTLWTHRCLESGATPTIHSVIVSTPKLRVSRCRHSIPTI
jgi:hypothetical protein